MHVREFNEQSDLRGVEQCFRELQAFSRTKDERLPIGDEIAGAYLQALIERCDAHGGRIFVAEDGGGEIVGYVCVLSRVPCAEPADGLMEEAQVIDLVVTERARGQGVGPRLMDAAEDFAADQGASWVRISVFAWNEAARALYAKRGYSDLEVTLEKRLRRASGDEAMGGPGTA